MANAHKVSFKLNGNGVEVAVEARELLIDTLRERLGHTGPHIGCETSHCGACTVDVDGMSVKACTVLTVQCDGAEMLAVEGLEQGGADTPCGTAPRVFWGHSQPTWQAGFNSTVTLFNNLRLYARVDGNGGHIQSNTEIRALHNQGSSKAVILRNDPLLQVYRAIEADAPGTILEILVENGKPVEFGQKLFRVRKA